MLHLSKTDDRFSWKSNPLFVFISPKFAGLKRTLLLPVEFNRCVLPIAVDLGEPINGSDPTQRLNRDCPERADKNKMIKRIL
tara:strand:+ start:193 stop:438 length:246 start_codon:yes stop_codon:yes gene_type:complete